MQHPEPNPRPAETHRDLSGAFLCVAQSLAALAEAREALARAETSTALALRALARLDPALVAEVQESGLEAPSEPTPLLEVAGVGVSVGPGGEVIVERRPRSSSNGTSREHE